MKTIYMISLIFAISISFLLFDNEADNNLGQLDNANPMAAQTESKKEEKSSNLVDNKKETIRQMSVSGNGNTIVYELNDSQAAIDLYEQLPLSVEVETFANNEIIFYPPEKLEVSNTPLAKKGSAGTIAYYAPWGDVVMFYDSYNPASGLYELGHVVSGSEFIHSMSGTISFTKTNE